MREYFIFKICSRFNDISELFLTDPIPITFTRIEKKVFLEIKKNSLVSDYFFFITKKRWFAFFFFLITIVPFSYKQYVIFPYCVHGTFLNISCEIYNVKWKKITSLHLTKKSSFFTSQRIHSKKEPRDKSCLYLCALFRENWYMVRKWSLRSSPIPWYI